MSLPIDTEAIAAQAKAEHEYGERLMNCAEYLATNDESESVTAEHIRRAVEWFEPEHQRGKPPLPSPAQWFSAGPQRATPASPAQLKATAAQAKEAVERASIEAKETGERIRCICAERLGAKSAGEYSPKTQVSGVE